MATAAVRPGADAVLPVHKSPAALALFLFLNSGIKTSQFNKESITIRFLFKKLGLSTAPRTYFLSRAVNRALAVINDHLDKLPVTAHLKVPVQYKFVAIGGGRIRFELIPRPYREDDDSDEPQTPARRAKTRRTAKTGRKSMEEPAPTPEPAPAPEPTPTLGEKPQPLTSEEWKTMGKKQTMALYRPRRRCHCRGRTRIPHAASAAFRKIDRYRGLLMGKPQNRDVLVRFWHHRRDVLVHDG